jgi:putative transposase
LKENKNKYNIKKACKILKISRSGYYDFLKRRKSKRAIANEALTEIIEDIFHENNSRYGARRIQLVLEKRGIKVNTKTVSKLMSQHGLIAKGARKSYRRSPNSKPYEEKENILNRVFTAKERNKIWVGDITYIPTKHGFLYLAVFIDIYSRKVTGWAMDTRIRDTLVLSALNQAIGREHPEEGLLVHTDRGSQYTSQRFQALLVRYSIQQSMSRKGNPYDNAIMESFYRTLKRELVQDAHYDTPEQARQDIFRYIELYYNTKRIHSAIGWLSPTQFEAQNY